MTVVKKENVIQVQLTLVIKVCLTPTFFDYFLLSALSANSFFISLPLLFPKIQIALPLSLVLATPGIHIGSRTFVLIAV